MFLRRDLRHWADYYAHTLLEKAGSCHFVVGWLQWIDLLEIVAYIARDNPNAAQELNLKPNG